MGQRNFFLLKYEVLIWIILQFSRGQLISFNLMILILFSGCLNRLSTKHQLWKSIQNSMLCQDLVLQCQIHNNQELVVVHADDFKNWFNGSCQQICKNQLACEHICKLVCHLKDRNHANYKCREPCKR